MKRCNSIAVYTGRVCKNLASFLGRCYVHARRPLEEPPPKSSKDHDLGCASLRPTTCDCRKGANRRMKRKAENMIKRQKVTVEEIKGPWTRCSDCGEPVHIQALTTNEHECNG